MEWYFPRWGVSLRDVALVNGMWCYFPGWGVSIRDGVFFSRMVLVYGMGCY